LGGSVGRGPPKRRAHARHYARTRRRSLQVQIINDETQKPMAHARLHTTAFTLLMVHVPATIRAQKSGNIQDPFGPINGRTSKMGGRSRQLRGRERAFEHVTHRAETCCKRRSVSRSNRFTIQRCRIRVQNTMTQNGADHDYPDSRTYRLQEGTRKVCSLYHVVAFNSTDIQRG